MQPVLVRMKTCPHTDRGMWYRFTGVFTKTRPNIQRIQFIGLVGKPARVLLTVSRPADVESVLPLSMIPYALEGQPIMWLGHARAWGVGTGLKYYVQKGLLSHLGDDESDRALLCMAEADSSADMLVLVLDKKGEVPDYVRSIPS